MWFAERFLDDGEGVDDVLPWKIELSEILPGFLREICIGDAVGHLRV